MSADTGPRPEIETAPVADLHAAIVEAYPILLRRAVYLTRDREDAKDLVQRTVERACASRRQLKAGSNTAHWLGTILTNQFIDEIRRHRSSPFAHGIAHDNLAGPAAEVRPIWSSLELDDVLAAVRRVPDRFRIPFELHALRGLSHRAISLRLGLPMGTIATRIHRAKRVLKGLLTERALKRMGEAAIPLPVGISRPAAPERSLDASSPGVLLEERPDEFAGVEVARGGAAG